MIEQPLALHDSERRVSAFFAGGEGRQRHQHAQRGRGCVEATTVSTRVSSSVDEGTTVKGKNPNGMPGGEVACVQAHGPNHVVAR